MIDSGMFLNLHSQSHTCPDTLLQIIPPSLSAFSSVDRFPSTDRADTSLSSPPDAPDCPPHRYSRFLPSALLFASIQTSPSGSATKLDETFCPSRLQFQSNNLEAQPLRRGVDRVLVPIVRLALGATPEEPHPQCSRTGHPFHDCLIMF